MRNLALIAGALAVAGCGGTLPEVKMYDGPVQTGQEVRLEAAAGAGKVEIVKVDGKAPVGGLAGLDHQARAVFLLPGKHTVVAKFSEGSGVAYSRELWFVGEPGKTYFLRADPASASFLGSTSVQFWIQDGTARRVGGVVVRGK